MVPGVCGKLQITANDLERGGMNWAGGNGVETRGNVLCQEQGFQD